MQWETAQGKVRLNWGHAPTAGALDLWKPNAWFLPAVVGGYRQHFGA